MMRLVIKWSYGDGYTYSCDETEPVEFESAEAFLVGFEDVLTVAHARNVGSFSFCGREWNTEHFQIRNHDHKGRYTETTLNLPTVLTVDEWFTQYCQ